MHLDARGPLSAALLDLLSGASSSDVDAAAALTALATKAVHAGGDLVADDDVQLTLYLMHELHYSGGPVKASDGPDWEWHPDLLRCRQVLTDALERQLRDTFAVDAPDDPADVPAALFAMARAEPLSGPGDATPRRRPTSVASFVARKATLEQLREILVLRSPYQLKEADPHTFAIPRLRGRAKAALVEVQADEYGGGRLDHMHSQLFARSMRSVGLDDSPNGYLDLAPAVVLASINAMTHFALHHRLRGALCGHLAAFEMTSSLPAKRYVAGMRRLGLGRDAWLFFDEHIEADAVHEQIAAGDLCGSLVADEPELATDVLLGAAVCLGLDARVSEHVLAAWTSGRSALRGQLPDVQLPDADDGQARTPAALHLLREPSPSSAADDTAEAAG